MLFPQNLWRILKKVKGWDCVEVGSECALGLGRIIQEEMGVRVGYLQDLYHTLSRPVSSFRDNAVRRLTLARRNPTCRTPPSRIRQV